MSPRVFRVLLLVVAGLAIAAAALGGAFASGGSEARSEPVRRLAVGFQDDPAFRWSADRLSRLDEARKANARMVRTFVDWSTVAPVRPLRPGNPFDPTYRLEDVDDLVRQSQLRGLDVLITIWGTPAWANAGAGRNRLPTRLTELTAFARAISHRYSGLYPGYPLVRHWTVWNEPNLEQFLAPQFDTKGRDVAPALYARLYRAAWKGIKAGNPQALVGIGETSPWGRDHVATSTLQPTHSPARFAELVALADPKLPFDAWAHHPYPTSLGLPPEQVTRWPNVSLTALPRFSDRLDAWFHRRNTPIWITEYGYQTRRPAAFGVTAAEQATYGARALRIAAANTDVQLFVWFVLHDSATTPWRSGLLDLAGRRKPAFAAFAAEAKRLDTSDAIVRASAGKGPVHLPVEALSLTSHNGAGALVGVTWRAYAGSLLVGVGQAELALGSDGRVIVPAAFARAAGASYRVVVDVGDINGLTVSHTLQIRT